MYASASHTKGPGPSVDNITLLVRESEKVIQSNVTNFMISHMELKYRAYTLTKLSLA